MANRSLVSGFGIKQPDKEEITNLLKRANEENLKVHQTKISSKLSLTEKLLIINEEVLKRLGHRKKYTQVIRDQKEFEDYITEAIKTGRIAVDTETNNSVDTIACKIMGLCLYSPGLKQAYIPVNHVNPVTFEKLENQIAEDFIATQLDRLKGIKVLMHNAKFDIEVIDNTCYNGKSNSISCYWDTMLAQKILDENGSAKLKDIYEKYIDPSQESYSIETFFKGIKYEYVDPEIFALYAATDSYDTDKVYEWQLNQFKEIGDKNLYSVFKDIEMGVLPQVVRMEEVGLGLDLKYIKNLSKTYNEDLEKTKAKLDPILAQYQPLIDKYREEHPKTKLDNPISVTSPTQLAVLLYDILKLKSPDPEKPKGTGEEILTQLDHPLMKPILEFREKYKLISTYIDKMPKSLNPKTHKIHANFNQIGVEENTVVTGRFSSTNPNL